MAANEPESFSKPHNWRVVNPWGGLLGQPNHGEPDENSEVARSVYGETRLHSSGRDENTRSRRSNNAREVETPRVEGDSVAPVTNRSLSYRSTTTPANSEITATGSELDAYTSVTQNGSPVSSNASQA